MAFTKNAESSTNQPTDRLPIDLVLWCPQCFEQHVDEATPYICEKCGKDFNSHNIDASHAYFTCDKPAFEDPAHYEIFTAWLNPPHKSHRCTSCNHVWRPSDLPTNGVQFLQSIGKNDRFAKPVAFANGKDFEDAVTKSTDRLREAAKALVEAVGAIPKSLPLMKFNDATFIKKLADKSTAVKAALGDTK